MSAVKVKTLHGVDIDKAWQIHRQAQPKPWSLATFADCTTPPYAAVAVYTDECLAGYALILSVVDEATLMDIAVSPDFRCKGLGARLLEAVVSACIERKMSTLWLEVRASNHVAQQLYLTRGFEQIEVRKAYYDSPDGKEDAVIMRLSLATEPTAN